MSYRSWLKDVKRVEDIGELPNNETPEQLQRWSQRLNFRPHWMSNNDFEFFQRRCHDSSILWIDRKGVTFDIAYADDLSSELRNIIDELLGVSTPDAVFPIILTFENCSYVNFVSPDKSGPFRWFDIDSIEVRQVKRNTFPRDELLCGWLFEQDSRIQAVMSACRYNPKAPFRTDFYALIDCERIKVTSQINDFALKYYGPAGAMVFKDYQVHYERKNSLGKFSWPHSNVELIKKLIFENGLTSDSVESWRAANPFEYKLRKPSKSSPRAGAETGF